MTEQSLWNYAIHNFYNKEEFEIIDGDFNKYTTSGTMLWCDTVNEAHIIMSRFRYWSPVLLAYRKCIRVEPELVVALDIAWDVWTKTDN